MAALQLVAAQLAGTNKHRRVFPPLHSYVSNDQTLKMSYFVYLYQKYMLLL